MENRPLVLVADDQPEIRKLVSMSLEVEGFRVITAADGQTALARLSDANPDVLVLDVMMPAMSGLDVLREVRSNHPCPVIILSARGSTANVSEVLDLGADDYVTKPFHASELAARIRAVIRRSRRGMAGGTRNVGRAKVDLDQRQVFLDGKPVRLSRSEWLLLELLVANEGRILLHHEILTHVWGPEYRDEIAYLRLWIGQLRRKLGVPAWEEGTIRTIQGLGYAFDPEGILPRMQSRRPRHRSPAASPAEPTPRDRVPAPSGKDETAPVAARR